MTSPTQRTLAYFRERGRPCCVVEKWNPHARVRQDAFGGIDILVLDGRPGVLGVQACAGASASARCTKLSELTTMADWLRHDNRLQVIAWRKVGERGKRKTWQPRVLHAHMPDPAHHVIEWTESDPYVPEPIPF